MNKVKHANSFDFVRLVGSLMVLYSHSFAVAGLPEPVIGGFCSYGSLGVFIFFSISGYLVTMSWLSDANVVRFAARRALRIFPALAAVILLSAFVLGPMVTTAPIGAYFRHPATYRYLETIALYINYYLPGCFEHAPLSGIMNGSLWSLSPEVLMYVALAALGAAALVVRRGYMLVFGGIVGFAQLYLLRTTALIVPLVRWTIPPYPAPVLFYGMELHQVMLVAPYFWAGCLFWLYREHLKLTMNMTVAMFMLLALLPPGNWMWVCSWFAIPYIVLAFCTQSDHRFRLPGWLGDLSYGIYIYAFPIQQTVYLYCRAKLSIMQMIALNTILTLICSYLSWHLIENPFLRLKPRQRKIGPAKGDGNN